MAGFWDSFTQNLGTGMQTAGEILSPAVAQRQAEQRQLVLRSQLALQAQQRELAARAIISGVQSGSIDPQIGRQKLAQLGMGDVPVGPSLEAQGTKAFMDWQQGGGQPATPSAPGMSPTPGMTMPPASAAASPLYGRFIEAQRAKLEEQRLRQDLQKPPPVRTRIEGDKEIQEQYDRSSGKWTKIGEGPRFARQVAPVVNVGGQGEKGWQLGTSKNAGGVIRVNPNLGIAQAQGPDGNWKKIAIPDDFMVTSASTAGLNNPAMTDDAAKLIADYNMPPLSGWALSRPQGQALMSRVRQLNPDYDATLYYRKNRMEGDIATGKTGTLTRSFNVFIQHTDVMREAAGALANGDVQQFNKLSQELAQQTGRPAPTNFDAVKKIYADELVKAIVGTGGNVSDREAAAEALNRAQSPQQLMSIMDSYNKLIAGQVMGVRKQYETSTGRKDFENFLLPKTKAVLRKYGYTSEQEADQGNAPKEAIDYLKAHPETKDAFKAKYGYLPNG